MIVLGMQVFALGLLGELIIFTHARSVKDYRVEEVIQYPEAEVSASAASTEADSGAKPRISHTAPPAIA